MHALCGLLQALYGILEAPDELHRHYVGYYNICVGCCILYAGFSRAMWDDVASIHEAQALCVLLHALCGMLHPMTGLLHPLCMIHMCYVDC